MSSGLHLGVLLIQKPYLHQLDNYGNDVEYGNVKLNGNDVTECLNPITKFTSHPALLQTLVYLFSWLKLFSESFFVFFNHISRLTLLIGSKKSALPFLRGVNSLWSVLVFDCIFPRKSFPNSYMDMGYSNPRVNFSDVCTKSYTVRTCLAFCLLVEYFCYYITCRQENELPKIEPPKPRFAMIGNERPFKLFIIWLFLEKKIFFHILLTMTS